MQTEAAERSECWFPVVLPQFIQPRTPGHGIQTPCQVYLPSELNLYREFLTNRAESSFLETSKCDQVDTGD